MANQRNTLTLTGFHYTLYITISAVMFLCTFPFLVMQTFLTLSLQDMASRVQLSGPQEAEKYVLHMVSHQYHHHHQQYDNSCVKNTQKINIFI